MAKCDECDDTGRWQFGTSRHVQFLASNMPCPRGCPETWPCDAAGCEGRAQTTFVAREDGELGGRHWQAGDALHYCWPHARKIYNDKDPLED
jgi:hypothetical protein